MSASNSNSSSSSSSSSRSSKTLFSLSLLLFSLSLLSFAGTFVRHHGITTMTTTSSNSAAIACSCSCLEPTGDADVGVGVDVDVAVKLPSSSSSSASSRKQKHDDHNDDHNEMLIGYKILHHTLKKESQLRFLHWLRDATFRGPRGSLKVLMTTIYETSHRRKRELERLLREETPRLRLKDAPFSAMGDSIQNDVEASSTVELVPMPFGSASSSSSSTAPPSSLVPISPSPSPSGVVSEWGVRFLLIQGQATRMVVALSTSLLKFDPSPERREWLTALADEYEAIREDLVECLGYGIGIGVGVGVGVGGEEYANHS